MKHLILAFGAFAVAAALAPAAQASKPYKCPREFKVDPEDLAKAKAEAETQRKSLLRATAYSPNAMVDMASLMEQGDESAAIDRNGAFDLYQRAADKGDRYGRQKTCLAYLLGQGRPRDIVKGMPYCNALGVKDGVGLFAAGYDYQMGLSGPKDEDTALSLYIQAADLGSGDAAAAMGRKALELGKPEAARQWFRRGTYFGSADAMDALAAMLEADQGGAADPAEARWLYAIAAERGNGHAMERVAALDAADPQNNPATALPVCLTEDSKSGTEIVRSYSDKHGVHQEKIGFPDLVRVLTDNFPRGAADTQISGRTTVECFIGGDHKVDVCVIRREYPVGFGYGPTVETIFNGHITVGDSDAAGNPTAHRLMKLTVRYEFSH